MTKERKKKRRSMKGYWITLACWSAFPAVLKLGFRLSLGPAFAPLYAFLYGGFLLIAATYEHFAALSYLEKHHSYEVKRVKLMLASPWKSGVDLERGNIWRYFNAASFPDDEGWQETYNFYSHFGYFLFTSLAAAFICVVFYTIWESLA